MDWKKIVLENKGAFICLGALVVVIYLLFNPMLLVNAINPSWDDNPFDYIRETEERVYINGTIVHVEYIDWEHCELFMENGRDHYFAKDAYAELKRYEGQEVTIMCYTQGWDGYYRLYACNDWEMGYVKPLN